MKKIKVSSRIILSVCAVALIGVLFVPMWRIELNAPQYPEGLVLMIYANKLGGSVDIINGLNHYIGMKTLHDKDFFEFAVLPGIILFFSIVFLLVALIGKRKWMNLLFALFVLFGVIAMTDFWRWEYQYGHELNPDAAIRIPDMAYQPPLIGFKQLLNFGAYSVPDIGGWIFVGIGAILLLLVVLEQKRYFKYKRFTGILSIVLMLLSISTISGCNTDPEAIRIGRDNCYFCKMTVSDARYGAELITRKGKVFKFDDAQCLLSFLQTGAIKKNEVSNIYFTDFSGDHTLVRSDEAFLLRSESLQGPMNGNVVAFRAEDSMKKTAGLYKSERINWDQLNK